MEALKLVLAMYSLFAFVELGFGTDQGFHPKDHNNCHDKKRWGYIMPIRFVACKTVMFFDAEG